MSAPMDQAALRELICHAAHNIAQSGYVAANDGNLSARCPDGTILVTPSGVYKGDLRPDMLAVVSLDGTVVEEGSAPPSSETPMHLALYRAHPDLGGVVHTHSPYAVLMANLGRDLTAPVTADAVLLLGNVPALPWLPLGTEELAAAVAEAGRESNAALLAHHGAVTWGRDVTEAWYRTQALEQWCRQLYLGLLLERPVPVLSPEAVATLVRRRRAGGATRGGDAMPPEN